MIKFLKIFQNLDSSISYLFSNNANENKFVKSFLDKKKITIIDAGANLGTYVKLLEKNFNIKNGYLFEPSRKCFLHLKNQYKDKYTIMNIALSNKDKKKTFYENEVLSQSSLIKRKNNFNKKFKINKNYLVKCTSLDNFYKKKKLNYIFDILKIDCEGEDYNVLKGAKNLLKKRKIRLVKIEIENNDKLIEIINFLKKYDYNLITITKSKFFKNKLVFFDAYFSFKKFL